MHISFMRSSASHIAVISVYDPLTGGRDRALSHLLRLLFRPPSSDKENLAAEETSLQSPVSSGFYIEWMRTTEILDILVGR